MALHLLCPGCGARYVVENEQAGKTATCPACGTLARVPAMDSMDGPAADPYRSPQAPLGMPPSTYGAAYDPQTAAGFEVHRKVIGVMNIFVALFQVSWAALCVLVVLAATQGAMPPNVRAEEIQAAVAIYSGMGCLSVLSAVLALVAGVALLARRRGCRNLGIVAGIINCLACWGCCVYVISLAVGIYSLVILFGRDAHDALG